MTTTKQGRSAHPARWLLALTLGATLAVSPLLTSAPPAQAAATPVAVDDSYSTTQGSPLTFFPSVLANDDLGGQSLNWDGKSLPSHGTIGGTYPNYVYTPAAGFSGIDSFKYCITQSSGFECLSNLATVTITVEAGKALDDHFSTSAGTALTITASMVKANDPSGMLRLKLVDAPKHGRLMTVASTPSGIDVSYTPAAGFVGVDTYTYCLVVAFAPGTPCDSNVATVYINVGFPATTRVSGADRYEVAVQVANNMFPSTAPVLFVASGVNYPDALSAGPAAAKLGGALLLTLPDRVPENVAAKVSSLRPGRIVIVGGVNSVSEAVVGQLKTLVPGATVERIGGADRYEVSRAIADTMFGPFAHADVATGATFADALSAGAATGSVGEPVVLVRGDAQSADAPTLALFAAHATSSLTIVGGVNSVSAAVEASLHAVGPVTRIGGADRFEASSNLNHAAFTKADTVYLATGLNFPDALAGSVLAGSTKSPLYVVPKSCVPKAVIDDIVRLGAKNVVLLGGPNSLSEEVAQLNACTP